MFWQLHPLDGLHNRFWHPRSSHQCHDKEFQDPQSLEEKQHTEDFGMLARVEPEQDTVAALAENSGDLVSSLKVNARTVRT